MLHLNAPESRLNHVIDSERKISPARLRNRHVLSAHVHVPSETLINALACEWAIVGSPYYVHTRYTRYLTDRNFPRSRRAHSKECAFFSLRYSTAARERLDDYRVSSVEKATRTRRRWRIRPIASAYCYGGRRRMENGEDEPTLRVAMGLNSLLGCEEHFVRRSWSASDRPHDTSRVTSVSGNMPRPKAC